MGTLPSYPTNRERDVCLDHWQWQAREGWNGKGEEFSPTCSREKHVTANNKRKLVPIFIGSRKKNPPPTPSLPHASNPPSKAAPSSQPFANRTTLAEATKHHDTKTDVQPWERWVSQTGEEAVREPDQREQWLRARCDQYHSRQQQIPDRSRPRCESEHSRWWREIARTATAPCSFAYRKTTPTSRQVEPMWGVQERAEKRWPLNRKLSKNISRIQWNM